MTAGAATARDGNMASEENRSFGDGPFADDRRRAQAFRSAKRHTARVRWLRRFILVGAADVTFGLVWYSWFRAQDIGEKHFSLDGLGLSGDKITMEHPRLTGLRRDGKPYDVTAETGVQNPRDPTRTVLNKLDAKLRMADDTDMRILGDTGTYDNNAQILDLAGNVRIKGSNFVLLLKSATMNFKTNVFKSDERARLDFDNGWVEADSMISTENGEQITFSGNVTSQFVQPPQQEPDAPAQKDSTQ